MHVSHELLKKLPRHALFKFVCLALLLASLAFPAATCSMPAYPGVIILEQADGGRFPARRWGDEFSHGFETVVGQSIVYDAARSSWVYAGLNKENRLTSTGILVGGLQGANLPKFIRPSLPPTVQKIFDARSKARVGLGVPFGKTGTLNLPVLMINFSDTTTTATPEIFQQTLFGIGIHSLKEYLQEVSYGAFLVNEGPSGFGGWYTAANPHEY